MLQSTICPRMNFSVWKAPTDYEVEHAKFPTPKEIFPKENPAAYTTLNDLTPSLFKNVQGMRKGFHRKESSEKLMHFLNKKYT